MKKIRANKGFTTIELLVVISIISLLSSIIIVATNSAKAKGRDSAKVATSRQVATALVAFNIDKNKMPADYVNTDGSYNPSGTGNAIAFEDQSNPQNPTTNSGKAYEASMRELVDGGYISSVPHSTAGQPYAYYDYGPGSVAGAIFGSSLEQVPLSQTGLSGSCRPIPATSGFNPNADFNNDGSIDVADLGIIGANYETAGDHSHGDTNGDGFIDVGDLGVLGASYGTSVNDPGYHNFCSQNYTTDYCICANY